MHRLSLEDLGFILGDRRSQPLHVGSLNLFKPPAGAPRDFVQKLAERLRSYCAPQRPFNQRLERRLSGLFWTEDAEFDIDHHLVHLSLPQPARIRELLAMVSRIHASHLDRAYPLWRTYLIEGLDDGRIAVYSKIHHAVADGIAGTRLLLKSMSTDPEAQLPPAWALPPRELKRSPDAAGLPLGGPTRVASMYGRSLGGLPAVAREVWRSIGEARAGHPHFVSGYEAPRTILNQPVSASRRFVAQSYSLARVKAVGKSLKCTVNDVVLGMCSSALRRYLMEQHALPEKPLIAGVPVSLRRDRSENGNQVAFLLANLATHLADPGERLDRIRHSVEHAKQRYQRMSPAEIIGYNATAFAPALINLGTGFNPRWQQFNVVISNVPGPRSTLYWQGCQLDGLYPVSVLLDGQALNITLTSRADSLDFGIIACRRRVPGVQHLLDYLEEGLQELERVANLPLGEQGPRASGPTLISSHAARVREAEVSG